jgi:uncharacterized protein (UPF0332 family)
LEKAMRALEQAKLNIPLKSWEVIANRFYYAAYYAVSALLIANGYYVKGHDSIVRMFGLHFVKTGKFSREQGKLYNKLYTLRLTGDYNDHYNGCIVPVFNWGCGSYEVQKKVAADGTTIYFEDYPDATKVGCIQCVCRDADGIAEYECSFEGRNVVHNQYSYGMQIGSFPSFQWNGAGNNKRGVGGSLNDKWVK